MGDSQNVGIGVRPKYKVGDEVRVWPIFKRPLGTVVEIEDPQAVPTKYRVSYLYEDGYTYTDTFEAGDLTLVKKFGKLQDVVCDCGSLENNTHSFWCQRY